MKFIFGHHITTLVLLVAICTASYGFWGAYNELRANKINVAAMQGRLMYLQHQQQELTRKETILRQVTAFSDQARQLGLLRQNWSFYDVNVQAPLSYESAQEIIYQCRDSKTAYYWPISLEVKSQKVASDAPSSIAKQGTPGDVQLIIKGKFVAPQQ